MFGKKKSKLFSPEPVGDYTLRLATQADLKEVRRLVLEAAKKQPSLVGLSYSDLKKADDAYWHAWITEFEVNSRSMLALLLHKEKTPVGFLMIEGEPEVRLSHTAVLTPMYVEEKHKNEQVEEKLLQSALNYLHQFSDLRKVRMSLTSDNAKEFPLYGSVGFVRFGFDEQHIQVGKKFYDCVLLVKSF